MPCKSSILWSYLAHFLPQAKTKNKEKLPRKKFLILWETEFSCANIDKFLVSLYFLKRKYIICPKTKIRTPHPPPPPLPPKKLKKKLPKRCSLYFQKWIFLALTFKKFLYSLKRNLFLYFRKRNPVLFSPTLRNKRNPPGENF